MPADTGLCEFCYQLKPVAHTDAVGRAYCAECVAALVEVASPTILDYLSATVPFQLGDRVECRTAGALYDGVGVIDEVSTELAKFGTPVHPSFHVRIIEKAYPEAPDELWYMENQLQKVES